jgi:hypothetical protein
LSSSDDEEEEEQEDGEGGGSWPLRLGGHASASHMTAGALVDVSSGGKTTTLYATGDEARMAPVAWRLPQVLVGRRRQRSSGSAGRRREQQQQQQPSLAAPLPAPLPSPVLAVAGACVPGLTGGGEGGPPPLLLAAASAGCVRVYRARSSSWD